MILCGTIVRYDRYHTYLPYNLLLIISDTALIPAQAIRVQAVIVQDCHAASRAPGTTAHNSILIISGTALIPAQAIRVQGALLLTSRFCIREPATTVRVAAQLS